MARQTSLMQRIFQRAEEMGLEQDLARLSGLDDIRMDAILHGDSVSSTEFELICRALAVDSGAIYTGNASNPARSPVRFRAATAIENPSPMDVRLLALASEQGRILGRLMALQGKEIRLRRHRAPWVSGGVRFGGKDMSLEKPRGRLWPLPAAPVEPSRTAQ